MNAIDHAFAHIAPAAQAPSAAGPRRPHALPDALFERARLAWREAAARKLLTSDSIAAWAILRGADPAKGFCPITNATKLANGQDPWGAKTAALSSCSRLTRSALAPWEALLAEQGASFKGYQWSGDHPILAALAASKTA